MSTQFETLVEKQSLIVNINMMREAIGIERSNVEWLLSKPVEYLREEQDSSIKHYNQAIANRKTRQY